MFYHLSAVGVRVWRVVDLPTTGHLSNVSKLVVPVRAGMGNDGHQPMFPEFDALLEISRLQVERERLRLQRQQVKAARKSHHSHEHAEEPAEPLSSRQRLPLNSKWHTWRGFVLDLQRLESLLSPEQHVTDENLGMLGPDSARTIARVKKGYGLTRSDGPPSTWNPDEARVYRPPPKRKNDT